MTLLGPAELVDAPLARPDPAELPIEGEEYFREIGRPEDGRGDPRRGPTATACRATATATRRGPPTSPSPSPERSSKRFSIGAPRGSWRAAPRAVTRSTPLTARRTLHAASQARLVVARLEAGAEPRRRRARARRPRCSTTTPCRRARRAGRPGRSTLARLPRTGRANVADPLGGARAQRAIDRPGRPARRARLHGVVVEQRVGGRVRAGGGSAPASRRASTSGLLAAWERPPAVSGSSALDCTRRRGA